MSSYTATPVFETIELPARVCVERRIFVGDDRNAFLEDWLKPFAEDYRAGRMEGYVLDLTAGRLWAALDLSDVSPATYHDIAVLSVQPSNDVEAAEAFRTLTRTCDPITAENILTCSFNTIAWPTLATVCKVFTAQHSQLHESSVAVSWEYVVGTDLLLLAQAGSPVERQQVFHCLLSNGAEKNHAQRNQRDPKLKKFLKLRVDKETAAIVRKSIGSPLPEPLDRNHAIVLLSGIEAVLRYKRKRRLASNIKRLREGIYPRPLLRRAAA